MKNNERREFLKKMAYSAPVVASLGMLTSPTDASAKNGKSKLKAKK